MKFKKLILKNILNEVMEYREGLQHNLRYTLDSIELSLGLDSDWTLTVRGCDINRKNLEDFEVETEDLEQREIEIVKSILIKGSEVIFYLDRLDVSILDSYSNTFVFTGKNHNDYDTWVNNVLEDLGNKFVGSMDALDISILDISLLLERVVEGQEQKGFYYKIDRGLATVIDGPNRVDSFSPVGLAISMYPLDLNAVIADKTGINVDLLTYGFDFEKPILDSELEKHLIFKDFELVVKPGKNTLDFYLDNEIYLDVIYPSGVKRKGKEFLTYSIDNTQLPGKAVLELLDDFVEHILTGLDVDLLKMNAVKRDIYNQIIKILNTRVVNQVYRWDRDKLIIRS